MGTSVMKTPKNFAMRNAERLTPFVKTSFMVPSSRSRVKRSKEKTRASNDIRIAITVVKSMEKKAFSNGLSRVPAWPVSNNGYSPRRMVNELPMLPSMPLVKMPRASGSLTISGLTAE